MTFCDLYWPFINESASKNSQNDGISERDIEELTFLKIVKNFKIRLNFLKPYIIRSKLTDMTWSHISARIAGLLYLPGTLWPMQGKENLFLH